MGIKLPSINIDNMDIKLNLEGLVLNVLYVKFGYFYRPMPEHSHSHNSYELHYIPAGQGILYAQGKRYAITPGTIYVTGPDVVHEQLPLPEDPMAEYCIFFEILPDNSVLPPVKRTFVKEPALPELLMSTPFWIGLDSGKMLGLFEMLADELSLEQAGVHHMATNILEMIVIQWIRQYRKNPASTQSLPLKTLDDSRLLIIENSFLYHYDSITLKQLADQLGLSTRQTERMVYKQYGKAFTDKKLQARMGAASRLLLTTDTSVSRIAAQVGYTTPEQFSNAFKKYFGMTATGYRSLEV
ncbi:AraC family transcriptional regulator [Paenibacillus sp. FSL R7-0273]|uniref:AraC family transcriptional regulator n=1 Tax=Paenibacillus sp. FSL R7-0273 TaxID=1536772 RepID=UPI0004F7D4E0|nr:AraC family transcriptional regulator [Paenibacillus sp. FSL R7-0273]AIQ45758.1 AraC family transcriptional regulator [Paenibacillus sp. FSL R7-0273]OMF95281.1 AraC family transcriptional regulator [Paenibacillus sp. FSL R7-0273]